MYKLRPVITHPAQLQIKGRVSQLGQIDAGYSYFDSFSFEVETALCNVMTLIQKPKIVRCIHATVPEPVGLMSYGVASF